MAIFAGDRFAAGLAFVCLLAAGLVGTELIFSIQSEAQEQDSDMAQTTGRAGGEPPGDVQEIGLPPLEHYSEIVERPLFSSSRRPQEPDADPGPEEEATPEAPAPKTKLRLTGIVLTPTERAALFYDAAQRQSLRIQEGEEMEGWRLDQVQPDRVVLIQGDESHEMPLRRPRPKAPPPPLPAPGAATPQQAKALTAAERREKLKQKLREKFKAKNAK